MNIGYGKLNWTFNYACGSDMQNLRSADFNKRYVVSADCRFSNTSKAEYVSRLISILCSSSLRGSILAETISAKLINVPLFFELGLQSSFL